MIVSGKQGVLAVGRTNQHITTILLKDFLLETESISMPSMGSAHVAYAELHARLVW